MKLKTVNKSVFLFLTMCILLCSCMNQSDEVEDKGEMTSRIPRKFGATYMTMNNPYFVVLNENIKEVVEANGDVLITRDPAQSQEKQNMQIQEMIEEGVEAIFINPVDWKTIEPALQRCEEAKIPVFNIDTDVYDQKYIVASILSDNYDAGVQCAKDMMAKLTTANIVIINDDNISSTNLRVQGFMDTIAGKREYKVVIHKRTTTELEESMKEMKVILERKIDFDVILGGNDPTALGALAAIQQSHFEKEVLIYGVDGSPDGKAMIQAGYLEGTSTQSPIKIGRKAAETAYQYLKGNQVESKIIIPVTLVTRENLNQYDIAGWQ